MKYILTCAAALMLLSAKAQTDSTKVLNHEIGFNTVLLIRQLISNSPVNSAEQLPYSLFYNIYYKDCVGLRLGAGYLGYYYQTGFEGTSDPRQVSQRNMDLRAGLSYNFVHSRRLTLNAFADFVYEDNSIYSVTTATLNAVNKLTTTMKDYRVGFGAQAGVGVKYRIYKHLSLYAEVPFRVVGLKIRNSVRRSDNMGSFDLYEEAGTTRMARIFIPTTVYLVLGF